MYTYNFLGLTNRLLEEYNEVQLTSGNFSSAAGFQATAQDFINDALNDIYVFEDTEWPFLWTQKTFTTTVSLGTYSYDASLVSVDWDSFCVSRPSLPVTSLTCSGTTVTCTVSTGHQLTATNNDSAIINGASPSGYDGQWNITYVSPTVFTYQVPSNLSSPATGTITMIPPYNNNYLLLKNYDEYLRNWYDVDVNANQQALINASGGNNAAPSVPRFIVRKPDNNFIISPWPDRIYTIQYNGRTNPITSALSVSTDVPLIPSIFRQVIIDRAGVYVLAFRDNDTQLLRNDKRFDESVNRMRRILIPQSDYITYKN